MFTSTVSQHKCFYFNLIRFYFHKVQNRIQGELEIRLGIKKVIMFCFSGFF